MTNASYGVCHIVSVACTCVLSWGPIIKDYEVASYVQGMSLKYTSTQKLCSAKISIIQDYMMCIKCVENCVISHAKTIV